LRPDAGSTTAVPAPLDELLLDEGADLGSTRFPLRGGPKFIVAHSRDFTKA
jgi:hypothetical protein